MEYFNPDFRLSLENGAAIVFNIAPIVLLVSEAFLLLVQVPITGRDLHGGERQVDVGSGTPWRLFLHGEKIAREYINRYKKPYNVQS